MRCIVLAAWKRRLLSLIVLVLACASTAPARAADARVEKEAKALQKKAIEEDNLNVNYAAAVKKLQTAVTRCGADRCSVPLKASLLRDLGAMQLLSGNVDAGKANFAQAIRIDPSLELDPSYKNPMLDGVWSDVKSKSTAGGSDGGGAAGGAGGAASSEDFSHTPAAEAQVRTPVPIFVVYSGTEALGRVIAKYKVGGANDWKTLQLKKMGDGFGGLIPCKDVVVGTIQYFLQGFDAQNQAIAMSGSRTAPFSVEVKTELSGPVPSLPGKAAPAQCKDGGGGGGGGEAECPPDFPGCKAPKKDVGEDCDKDAQCSSERCNAGKCAEKDKKAGGEDCDDDDQCTSGTCSSGKCSEKKGGGDYCERDDDCTSGNCQESKCTEPSGEGWRRLWVGISVAVDLDLLGAATDVCLRKNGPTGDPANSAGYACYDPGGTGARFPQNAGEIIPGQGTPNTGSGVALGNIRIAASLDYALSGNVMLGLRAGWIAKTIPSAGASFAPFHGEARFTYLLGSRPLVRNSTAWMFLGALGVGEFDAYEPVVVRTNTPAVPACSQSSPGPNGTGNCSENAWLSAGPVFAAVGAGVRIGLGKSLAIPIVPIKFQVAFGGKAGNPLLGFSPEVGLQYGF